VDERGQGLVEYALILLLASLAVVLLLAALGADIRGLFESVTEVFP
jgi:Flp pilus assembly pilin Flp